MCRKVAHFLPAISVACLTALFGCANNTAPVTVAPSDTACTGNTAMIGVGDGFVQNLCGCGGSSGQIITPPDTLTCTTATGKATVFFEYVGTQTVHQIAPSVNSPLPFTASPLSDPRASTPVRVHAVQLTTGTYGFMDLFNSGLQGKIVVP